ncbi:MAG: hypothetical protein K6T81_15590 [Alicyclobacillus macrosporangiidus]|uniref:hypothetical protein n=1 Tax=Alicyclobacillus macrosporangiidus TaxID=392015 RepID=UPI0026F34624|nr:hypothetical protein [Alicyclobacillus macrosporangiidus]MCL6600140.1 hypothetical protein [Alicyclobacillus macrosporangiidus]
MKEAISDHLEQALTHVRNAIQLSVQAVIRDGQPRTAVSQTWEHFLSQFLDEVRSAGREHRINLLSWISFSKLWKR